LQIKITKGEKVDVILNNYFKELKVRNANQNSFDSSDELEVQASVTLHKLKEWLINKNYLDVDALKSKQFNIKQYIIYHLFITYSNFYFRIDYKQQREFKCKYIRRK